MKITKIERDGYTFTVTFKPGIIGRIFHQKEFTSKYRMSSYTYTFGGNVYIKQDGTQLGPMSWIGAALDKYNRSWK